MTRPVLELVAVPADEGTGDDLAEIRRLGYRVTIIPNGIGYHLDTDGVCAGAFLSLRIARLATTCPPIISGVPPCPIHHPRPLTVLP